MNKKYCERYDVMYDSETGEYLEKKCEDPNCIYCKERPRHLHTSCKDCTYQLFGNASCQGLRKK